MQRTVSLSFVFILAALALFAVPHASQAATINVSMGSNYFSPANVTVNSGDTVVWTNTDSMPHNVTEGNGTFESDTVEPGGTYALTFNVPATYSYHCTFHTGMNGSITVNGASPIAPSGQIPASGTDELRLQAQALLARIQELQQQLAASGGTYSGGGTTIDASSCPQIGRSLKRGSTGDDVSRLQQFLARDTSVYPEGIVSGTYGALTEAAVKRWQVKYHIVSSGTAATTGYGVVGPRTAAAIAILCSTGSYNGVSGPSGSANFGGFIQVTPVAGDAPLDVVVQATINTINSCAGGTYTLDWGDGTQPQSLVQPAGNCVQQTQTLGHRYAYGGTFQVMLSAGLHRTYAIVQVSGGGTPSPSPSPTGAPMNPFVVTPGVDDDPLKAQIDFEIASPCSAFDLDWGDGTSHISQRADTCALVITTKTYKHTYASGSYTITLKRGSQRDTAAITISTQ